MKGVDFVYVLFFPFLCLVCSIVCLFVCLTVVAFVFLFVCFCGA